MAQFRALNLLQGLEGGVVLGSELETILNSSPGRPAELGALVSLRHMARRMAANTLTMAAITSSAAARRVIFENTSEYNFRPIEQITKNQSAMANTSVLADALGAVIDNDVAWSYFRASPYYEENIVNTLTTIIGLDPADFNTTTALIENTSAMGDIATSTRAMKALVASTPTMAIVTARTAPMADIAANTNAMTIVANNIPSVRLIAQSQTALNEITNEARLVVISIPTSLAIVSSYESAWDYILGSSTTLSANIYPLLIAFGGLDPDTFGSVEAIFADTTASFAVANSKPAMMAMVYEAGYATTEGISSAMDKLIASDNLSTVLGSLVAITEIAEDVPTMNTLITNPFAFPVLLESSDAKAAIFASPTLVSTMMTTSSSLTLVQGMAQSATIVNNVLIGTYKSAGIAGNIIVLTAVMGSIVATTLLNRFQGDTQGPTEFALPGTSLSSGPIDIKLPFTNLTWDISSIAATAAGNVNITYADFN
jgi:hypothetical protein